MSVKHRQEMERTIAKAAIKSLLAAGFELTVNDGEEDTDVKRSRSARAILGAMFTTDEDYLIVCRPTDLSDQRFGWLYFVYGNTGWDVLSDYTTNLEDYLKPVHEVADKLCERYS